MARRAVYNNRARLLCSVARQAFKLRAEKVERSFAVILDIAETTMATGRLLASCAANRADTLMRAADPTLVPPNFMIRRSFN